MASRYKNKPRIEKVVGEVIEKGVFDYGFTTEESYEIRELLSLHGRNWKLIDEILGINRRDVRNFVHIRDHVLLDLVNLGR